MKIEKWNAVLFFVIYIELMRKEEKQNNKKTSHLPKSKSCCTFSNINLLLLVIIINFIVRKTDHLFCLQLNISLQFQAACKPRHVDKHNLAVALRRQWVKVIS